MVYESCAVGIFGFFFFGGDGVVVVVGLMEVL